MIRSQIIAGTVCLLSLFAAGAAHAEDSPSAGHASAAFLLGDGFKDGIGLGLGARGGYTLPMNLYLGGTFIYHLGKSEGGVSEHFYYFGVEGGYDLAAGPLIVRPYLGLGDSTVTASGTIAGFGSVSTSSSSLALWPGATALYPIGNLLVGADARYVIVTSSSTDSSGNSSTPSVFSLFATVGYQF
jgi:hypothetical protein